MACADVTSANVVGYQNLNMLAGGRQSMCFTFADVGQTAKKLMLTEIKVVGYQDSAYWQDQMAAPNILLKKLQSTGATEITYIWMDNFDDEVPGEWAGGKWAIFGGADITKDNDVTINPGQAFFVEADQIRDCTAYTLVFPACLAK